MLKAIKSPQAAPYKARPETDGVYSFDQGAFYGFMGELDIAAVRTRCKQGTIMP